MSFTLQCLILLSFCILVKCDPVSPGTDFLDVNQVALLDGIIFNRDTVYEAMNAAFLVMRQARNGQGPATYEWPQVFPDWESLYTRVVNMFPILTTRRTYKIGEDPGPYRVLISERNVVNVIKVTGSELQDYQSCEIVTQNIYDSFQND